MAEQGQERHLPATPKRKREALERGESPRSRELAGTAVLLAGLLSMVVFGSQAGERVVAILRQSLQALPHPQPARALAGGMGQAASLLAVPLVLMLVVAVAAHLVQGEVVFAPKALEPRWDRLDPVSRFRQLLLSRRSLMELLKSLLKVAIIGALCAWFIARELPALSALSRAGADSLLGHLGTMMMRLAFLGGTGLAVLALADAAYSRWDWQQRLRMTTQEMKDHLKEQDGDPLLRSRRRQRHRELSLNRVLSEVPRADVVVTNPTHLAVALRYRAEQMAAPQVVAKGADNMALRIRTIARQHGVPVMENRPLARALYRAVRVGQFIDEKFYQAVAEVYAFLHRLRGEAS